MKRKLYLCIVASATLSLAADLHSEVAFVDGSTYHQSFETGKNGVAPSTSVNDFGKHPWIENDSIVGWHAVIDDEVTTEYWASNGNKRTGAPDLFLFRDSGKDGALGTLRSAKNNGLTAFGLKIKNKSGSTITGFSINYLGQQWQNNTGHADQLTFQYSTDARSLTTGTWIEVESLTFNTLVDSGDTDYTSLAMATGVLDQIVSGSITRIHLRNESIIWIRWLDNKNPGVDQALSIDDLSVKPIFK